MRNKITRVFWVQRGLSHILDGLIIVMDQVEGLDAKTVAVLHDVIEDTNAFIVLDKNDIPMGIKYHIIKCGNTEHLYQDFDQVILIALDAITKHNNEKNEDYWKRVKNNPLALRVKMADIAHNSSEARLAHLPKEDAKYLRKKYAQAKAFFWLDQGLLPLIIGMKFGDAVEYLEKIDCFSPWNYIMDAEYDAKIEIGLDNIIKYAEQN